MAFLPSTAAGENRPFRFFLPENAVVKRKVHFAAVVGLNFRDHHGTFLSSIILTTKMRSALRITIVTLKTRGARHILVMKI